MFTGSPPYNERYKQYIQGVWDGTCNDCFLQAFLSTVFFFYLGIILMIKAGILFSVAIKPLEILNNVQISKLLP
jgi:hypothetical protein